MTKPRASPVKLWKYALGLIAAWLLINETTVAWLMNAFGAGGRALHPIVEPTIGGTVLVVGLRMIPFAALGAMVLVATVIPRFWPARLGIALAGGATAVGWVGVAIQHAVSTGDDLSEMLSFALAILVVIPVALLGGLISYALRRRRAEP